MNCCTGRCVLIVLCCLQLISTVERQVFEFLGYMWGTIIGNFLHIIFVTVGLFGACQYRHRILVVYCIWCIVWIVWNAFIICFYLEVGMLNRHLPILNIGTGNKSWWTNNGIGCQAANTSTDMQTWIADGCLLQYYYIEVIHAGLQCILTVLSFCTACIAIYIFTLEDDTTEPVHNELEYIRMRYRSPARQSFRGNKTYENLTVRSDCTTTTSDGTFRPPAHTATDDICKPLPEKISICTTDVTQHLMDPVWGDVATPTVPLTTERMS